MDKASVYQSSQSFIKTIYSETAEEDKVEPGSEPWMPKIFNYGLIKPTQIGQFNHEEFSVDIDLKEKQQEWAKEEAKSLSNSNSGESAISEREKSIIYQYFVLELKPKMIAMLNRTTKEFVYKLTEGLKKTIIKANSKPPNKYHHDELSQSEIAEKIKEYWDQNQNTFYTVQDVVRYINSSNQLCKIPSTKTIRRVMKEDLKLSYRRISWRPLKNHGSDLKMQRAHYIMFWREIEKKGIHIVQIDEFAINRDINPKMAWIKRGSPSYAIQETISNRFSWIWAITNSRWEMLTV